MGSNQQLTPLHNVIDDFVDETGSECVALAVVCKNGSVKIWAHAGITHEDQVNWMATRFREAASLAFKVNTKGEG